MMSIFSLLNSSGIEYAVVMSYQWIGSEAEVREEEYHLLVSSRHCGAARRVGVRVSKSALLRDLCERRLNYREVGAFRRLVGEGFFEETYRDENGVVYDVAGRSFRRHFRSIEPEERRGRRVVVIGEKVG